MRVCQFETDNDEQAKCEFERIYTTNVRTICYMFGVCFVYSCFVVMQSLNFKNVATITLSSNLIVYFK